MAPKSERNGGSRPAVTPAALAAVRNAATRTRFDTVDWVAETGSTNDDLAAAAAAGDAEQVLLTDLQTAGRGRRDRQWTAPAESGVLISFLVRERRGCAPFWTIGSVALGAAEAASLHAGVDVALKWPNDLMIGDEKTAGILAQGINDAVIVGLGLNVDWSAGRPTGVPDHATALDRHGREGTIDRAVLAADLIRLVDRWLGATVDEVHRAWSARCSTLGRDVRVELDAGPPLEGVAERVNEDGAIVVCNDTGHHVLHVGDVVHLRPSRPNNR